MFIKTEKSNLTEAIRVVSATTSQASMEQPSFSGDLSSFYVFRRKEEVFEVFSYSGPLISKCVIPHTSDGDDVCFAIESKRFNKWVSAISDGEVTINVDSKVIKAKSVNGTVSFPVTDTNNFPWWDGILSESKLLCEINPKRLERALDYVKMFISKDEKKRNLCVCEFLRPGDVSVLHSTNLRGIAMVEIPDMANSEMRLHGKDVPGIRKFLSTCGDDNVAVYEHPSCFFVKTTAGSVIGSMKPSASLPKINIKNPFENSDVWSSFVKEDFIRAVNILLSSSPDDNKLLDVSIESESGISLSMPSITGDNPIILVGSTNEGFKSPVNFHISYDLLVELIRKVPGDSITMSSKRVPKGGSNQSGYISFKNSFKEGESEDVYTSILGWETK